MISPGTLAGVRDREGLFRLLREELHWPLDPEDTFTYQGPELPETAAARVEVGRIVPFGAEDPFLILLAEFRTAFRRADLREILRALRREIRELGRYPGHSLEDMVFVCVDPGYAGVRFARFQEQEGRQARLSSFGWSREEVDSTRTLCEVNLPALALRQTLFHEPDWKEARPRWLGAWDVERVTRDFFREYREVFEEVEGMVLEVRGDRRLFTQRLFNRLMFIHFLSKKHWLRFSGSTDYLKALLAASMSSGENFYHDRLYWAFFYGLGSLEAGAEAHDIEQLRVRRGDVPYLNGGLFEMTDPDDSRGAVRISNSAFDRVINGLFARWNFTVSESTPLDVEVAVDPEMLGKVFEELVTGRHETGSYYTPRPVVSFMCREALKGYLAEGGRESAESLAQFVDEHDAGGLVDPEGVLEKLKSIRVCDPACGSGAYLLGMLHELVDLRRCLFRSARIDPATDYRRKLEIIQNNLYGVDIDEFAVNIARLRLWLSLAVEHQGESPEPLPNLDFKIEVGDSLLAPDPASAVSGGIDMFRAAEIKEFEQLKARYGDPYYAGSKAELKKKIEEVRRQLTEWLHRGGAVGGFDWWAEFAEVFLEGAGGQGGFDVVAANPPYVRQELIKELKPALKKVYGELFSGTADLYCYFYLRGLELLRPGGMLSFISSNKWFKAKYGTLLREHIAKTCQIRSITDFGELPVFQTAATFPMIFVAKKGGGSGEPVFTQVKSLAPPYPDVLALVKQDGNPVPIAAVSGTTWTLASAMVTDSLSKMAKRGIPLAEYVGGRLYSGVKTGLTDAFVIDGATRERLLERDSNSSEILKPFAIGDDVRRWRIVDRGRWLIYVPWDLDLQRYPAILHHLSRWQEQLSARPECRDGRYNWWCLARYAAGYSQEFELPKILYPEMAKEPRFAYDAGGTYTNNKAFFIPVPDMYLLGVLNSQPFWTYLSATCSALGDAGMRGRLELRSAYLNRGPVPLANEADRAAISALVQKCLEAKGVGCEEWEKEIDERVAGLYGL